MTNNLFFGVLEITKYRSLAYNDVGTVVDQMLRHVDIDNMATHYD